MHRILKVTPLLLLTGIGGISCKPVRPAHKEQFVANSANPISTFTFAPLSAGIPSATDPPAERTLGIQEASGTGIGLADFDGDGYLDLVVPRAPACALFRNGGGDSWQDVSSSSGIAAAGPAQGCSVADVDNDGRPDLLLTGIQGLTLLRNLGGLRFEKSASANLPREGWYTSAAFADLNRDGLPDLYAAGFVTVSESSSQFVIVGHSAETGDRVVGTAPAALYPPRAGRLFLNQGQGVFKDVTANWNLNSAGRTLGAVFSDVNLDGWPDLFLSNDSVPSELFLNAQGRGFKRQTSAYAPAYDRDGAIMSLRGCDAGDYNRDGRPDLVAGSDEDHGIALFSAIARGFEERGQVAGLGASRPFTSNSTMFADLDNDGWEDLIAVNGNWVTNADQISRFPGVKQFLQLFRNESGHFSPAAFKAGSAGNPPMLGRGLATGDLDNDGTTDLVISQLDSAPAVLKNTTASGAHWIRLKLAGTRSGREALGARVTLKAGAQSWLREVRRARGYLSSSDPRITVGLGAQTEVDEVSVNWPSGKVTVHRKLASDQEHILTEP